MAAAAGAEFLVTGDRALLELKRFSKTRIVTPRVLTAMLSRRRRTGSQRRK